MIRSPYPVRLIHTLLTALVVLLTVGVGAVSCSSDEALGGSAGGKVTGINLQLGTADSPTSRAAVDPNRKDHELIHSLRVVIVDKASGKVEWTAGGTGTAQLGDGADDAELTGKLYENITLSTGAKVLYAFANMEACRTTDGQPVEPLIEAAAVVGQTFTLDDNLVIADPAATIDFENGHYLPMSARTEVYVSRADQTLQVAMERLVSRLDLGVSNTGEEPMSVRKLQFGEVPDRVTLFPSTRAPEGTKYEKLTIASEPFAVSNDGTPVIHSRYINAKEAPQLDANSEEMPFSVTLDILIDGQTEWQSKVATTVRTNLARNYIYPVTLSNNNYVFEPNLKAQIAPIGALPVTITNLTGDGELLTYHYAVPEGATLTLAPTLQRKVGGTYESVEMAALDNADKANSGWYLHLTDADDYPSDDVVDNKLIRLLTDAGTTGSTFTAVISARAGSAIALDLESRTKAADPSQSRHVVYRMVFHVRSVDQFIPQPQGARHRAALWGTPSAEGIELLPLR